MRGPLAILLAAALALSGCGRREDPVPAPRKVVSERAVVSLPRAEGRAEPSGNAPAVRTLPRGTELKVVEARAGFWRVQPSDGGEVWLEPGSFERVADREARERRAEAVARFAPHPARAVERAPVLLAPAYEAARWGEVDDGDDLDVVLHDHDFYGVRVAGARLAFVPARSVRLLPSDPPAPVRPPRRQIVPEVTPLEPGEAPEGAAADDAQEPRRPASPVLEAIPPGGEPPVLLTRVEPAYPEAARRAGIGGEVVLKIVVTEEGKVGKVDVVSSAPAGLTEAAVDAVARWRYRPALVGERAVAVSKIVRIRFAPAR